MVKKVFSVFLIVVTASMLVSCSIKSTSETSIKRSEASTKLKKLLESDSELMGMMKKSIDKAQEINSDPNTNPVSNINTLIS